MKRLAILSLVLAAACGGGGTDKSEFLREAEAVCERANKAIEAAGSPTSPSALPAYVDKLIKVAETARDELKALDPPEEDKDELKSKVFDALDAQIEQGRRYAEDIKQAVASRDNAKLGRLIANPPTQTEADLAWMKSYGFKACVEVAETE